MTILFKPYKVLTKEKTAWGYNIENENLDGLKLTSNTMVFIEMESHKLTYQPRRIHIDDYQV